MWQIRESGKNGSVEIQDGALIRIIKKRVGKDDRQTIPLKGITSVSHDRKRMKTDELVLPQYGHWRWRPRRVRS